MEEVKKARKPRATKKSAQGESVPQEAVEVAAVAEETAVETAVEKAAVAEETKKKAPAKRTRKKAETAVKTEEVEPIKTEAEQQPEEAKPAKKKASKKQAKEAVKEESKAEETAVAKKTEEVVIEAAAEPVAVPEKTEEKPAKKAQKTAKKSAKNSEKTPEKEEKKPSKKAEKTVVLTRAQKKEIVKKLTKEVLQTECKWADLVDRVALRYQEEYPTPENANLNDVKGRVGSVLYVMQEEGEILVEGNLVKLSKNKQKTKKESTVSALSEDVTPKAEPAKEAVLEEKAEENTAVSKDESKDENKNESVAVVKVETAAPTTVYDLSALFDKGRSAKKAAPQKTVGDLAKEKEDELASTKPQVEEKPQATKKEEKPSVKTEKKSEAKAPAEKATTEKSPTEKSPTEKARKELTVRKPIRLGKADPLKEAFLKKLRSLGGNYFEYYAVYLLERYSRMNGRRLECLRISGGEYDGGIDGELELTDRLGFRETIYIQAKNWEPTDEKWWIGETLLQQFIGAVAYRQAKEGKQHCRGIYVTTSAFTAGAREMLEKMSDRFVGYDGDELYETAKECEFGIIKDGKGGYKVDEELLSGKKSFFFML